MRACGSFRVELHGESRERLVAHPFTGVVVDIDMAEFPNLRVDGIADYGIAMVLAGNLGAVVLQIFDRLVCPPVSVFELDRFRPICQRKELVSHTDSKNGDPKFGDFF